MRSRVAMSVISERWSKFFQTLLETLQRLRLDHCAHLGEHPHETAGFGMIELLLSSCAINPGCLRDQTTQCVERMTDQRALFRACFGPIRGGAWTIRPLPVMCSRRSAGQHSSCSP